MNVYILLGYTLPELTEIISVHLTKELARRKYQKNHPGYNGFDDHRGLGMGSAYHTSLPILIGDYVTEEQKQKARERSLKYYYAHNRRGRIMARPIEATPILKNKDADAFLNEMRCDEPVSSDRVQWLETLAEASKSAEGKKK